MCRNIKPLFNFEPPATDEEIRAAALQFVREAAFHAAIEAVAAACRTLLDSLETSAVPRDRAEEAAKARARAAQRFAR